MLAVLASVVLLGAPAPWQTWAEQSRVPTVHAQVQVTVSPTECACAWPGHITAPSAFDNLTYTPRQGRTFPLGQAVLYHELGHQFDYDLLTDQARTAFQQIARDHRAWWEPPNPPGEKFAQAYMLTAMFGARLPAGEWLTWSYDWKPTRKQQRQVYDLIVEVANANR